MQRMLHFITEWSHRAWWVAWLIFLAVQRPLPGVPPQGRSGPSLAAVQLRCEHAESPLGVDVPDPRLSWKLESRERGDYQTAYRILVASLAESLRQEVGDLWDSGKINSEQTAGVSYNGLPLKSSQQVFWQVRVWDRDGRVSSAWSPVATWTMGLLDSSDWSSSRWITYPDLLKWVRPHLGFHSEETNDPNTTKWIRLDFGEPRSMEVVRLRALQHTVQERTGFPRRFKLEASNNPEFVDPAMIADHTARDFSSEWSGLYVIPVKATARYLRLTAPALRISSGKACLAFSQIEVISEGKNIASEAKVSASDSWERGPWSAASVVDGLEIPGINPYANSTFLLRREFSVRAGLRRVLAFVSGLGQYEMTLNGRRVGSQLITPGWTHYEKTCLYDTHDITASIRTGANAVGLTLAGGMYNVQSGRYVKFVGPFRPLIARCQIRLEYSDGKVEIIGSDERWRIAPGPIVFSNVYGGEDYDARLAPREWDKPGFNDQAWTTAAAAPGSGGKLRGFSHAAPPLAAFETFRPVARKPLRPDADVYDLGQNTSMMLRIAVKGPAGSVVRVIPAELLNPDGSVDRRSSGSGSAWWQYTLSGSPSEGPIEIWEPKFFYHGLRYLQVERKPSGDGNALPVVETIEGIAVRSTSEPAGEFACSSELFNRIRMLVCWAQRSNIVSVLTDCPHREKLSWLEQYHLNGPALRYEFNLGRLFAKVMNDMADAQLDNGLVPDIAPEYTVFSGGFRDSPEWGSAFVIVPWQQYEWTGDLDLLRRHYEGMKRYVAYLEALSKEHIVSHGLGDWYDIGPKPPGEAQLTPKSLTATAFYYADVQILARTASLLGLPDDAGRYTVLAGKIRAAFTREFFHPETSQYASGSQAANSIPLVLDLVDSSHRNAVLENVVRDVRDRGNSITAGDVGFRYLLRALADGGRSDVIFDMNSQSERPGYGYQLKQGATSLTEAWDARRTSSQNHFMLGQITEWFYHDLAGIQSDPAGPGFRKIIIRPQPVGDITWVRASYKSIRGTIRSEWRYDGGMYRLDVSIPAGTTATVYVSSRSAADITENGLPLAGVPDVKLLRHEDGHAVLAVASGTYRFAAKRPPIR